VRDLVASRAVAVSFESKNVRFNFGAAALATTAIAGVVLEQ
jgi:hypothetical protein